MSREGEGGGFLSRWSRLKREAPDRREPEPPPVAEAEPTPAVPAEAAPEPAPPRAPSALEPPAGAACPVPGLAEIDLASLPRIEDLTAASDLSPFLRPGVPAALRAAALRRMWSVDPAIRDFIGCVDYQWDFNTPGGLPPGFAAELVGDVKKLLAQAIGEREEPDPEAPPPEGAEEGSAVADAAAGAAPPGAPPPAGAVGAEAPLLPQSPLRLDPDPLPDPGPEPLLAEPPPAPRRRHGGALPG